MITLLARWFIKQPPASENLAVRNRYGILCGVVGVVLNLLLAAAKLLAGILSGSIAITADALNNLSDAGSSLITLLGFRLARQTPDEGHPFGHGRMEYVAGLLVSVVILIMGFDLLRSSFSAIRAPTPVTLTPLPAIILAVSILVKLYMAFYNHRVGKAIGSPAMRATTIDSLSDAAATAVVLLAMVLGRHTAFPIDGWCGLLVSLLILWGGVSSLRDTVSLLLGQPPTQAFLDEISALVLAHADILAVHDVTVHDYGPGRRVITLHAEVPASGDILALHDTIDNAERELSQRLNCAALIHMDPIVTDDALTNQTRARVAEVVKGLDPRATIHDFRMVTGPTHTKLIFDVSMPYDVKLCEKEIQQRLAHMIHALDDTFYAVVTVDRFGEGR